MQPYNALSYSFFGYNMRNPLLADKKVREAIALALNRQEMLSSFFNSQGTVISGPFAPGSWAYNLDVKPLAFDPDKARALLAEAGFKPGADGTMEKGGKKLALSLKVPIEKESEAVKRVVLAFQNYLKAVGIAVNVEFKEWQAWKEDVFLEHNFDIMFASWVFDDSADISSLFHSAEIGAWKNNFGGYSNPEVDGLIVEAKLTLDHEKRRTINRSSTRCSPRSSRTRSSGRSPTTARSTARCGACRSTRTSSSRSPTNGSFPRASRSDVRLSAVKPVSRVLAHELAVTAALLAGVSVVVFAILYFAPGNPLHALGVREAEGMASTWPGQYAAWFGRVLRGDFGHSVRTGLPVLPEIARVGLNTLYLTLGALALTAAIAVPIAVHAAARGDTPGNTAATMVAYVLSAVPVFWFGYIVVYVFIHLFGMFPLISGTGHEAAARLALFAGADPRARDGERHALGDDPPPARGALARARRGLYPHRARQGRGGLAPRLQGRLPDPGHRDHEREDPVPARRRGDRRAGVQLARNGAHGVAGGAGPRLPGDHGHRARRAAFVRLGGLAQRVVFTAVNPRSFAGVGQWRATSSAAEPRKVSGLWFGPKSSICSTSATVSRSWRWCSLRTSPGRFGMAAARCAGDERRADQCAPFTAGPPLGTDFPRTRPCFAVGPGDPGLLASPACLRSRSPSRRHACSDLVAGYRGGWWTRSSPTSPTWSTRSPPGADPLGHRRLQARHLLHHGRGRHYRDAGDRQPGRGQDRISPAEELHRSGARARAAGAQRHSQAHPVAQLPHRAGDPGHARNGEAILIETSLSYLGFGVQEPTPSWGNMVQAGANYFLQGNFWPSTAPALAILATILGFQLLGDGLNNALEGKRRR
jgi:ABC-type dipeptide/oligopeptide/nickel transport system permease subunit